MSHILLIHQIFNTPKNGGGTRHYELAKALIKDGHHVSVITSDTDYLSGQNKEPSDELIDGIRVIQLPTYKRIHASIFHRAISFLSFSFKAFSQGLKIKNVDVIWGTSPPLFQSLSCLLLSIVKRAPFMFEVRDLWIDFAKQLGIVKNPLIYYPCKALEYLLYASSDTIIINSPGFEPYIPKKFRKKIRLFPNGVDVDEFKNIEPETVKELSTQLDTEKFIVAYTGNIGVANDIGCLLDAAEKLRHDPQIHFYIIGGGMKSVTYSDEAKTRQLTNVSFLPPIPKSQIPSLLSMCHVCVATLVNIPLFGTVYPNKVFDYMAAARPIVLGINGAIRSVVESANGGIVITPGNSQELADAVLTYKNDLHKMTQDGKNGQVYVSAHFSRADIGRELSEFFTTFSK